MLNSTKDQVSRQPKIFKYSQYKRVGIQVVSLLRHGIGYVLRGKMNVYSGDSRRCISAGDIFFLSAGSHYLEYIPENGKPFEQIIFYYTPQELGRIMTHLSINYHMAIDYQPSSAEHKKRQRQEFNFESCPAWGTVRNFFITANQYIKDDLFSGDITAENIKMTELIYLIVSQQDCSVKTKIMENVDDKKDNFEQIIYNNIFNDIALGDLARMSGRSMTSFKKEFKKFFKEPPHRWFIQQRLMHSRLLLISTSRSVAEIGNECSFPNTSHYIKLFKKEFGITPASYRVKYLKGGADNSSRVQELASMDVAM